MADFYLSINYYPQPYYVANVLFNHLYYYDSLDNLTEYFLPFWADTLAGLFDGTHSGTFINSLMPENPIEILLPDVIDDFTLNNENLFRLTLDENTLLDWTPIAPTYLMHAIGDDIIPIANAQVAYNSFMNSGATSVNLIEIPLSAGGHEDAAPVCLLAAFDTISTYQIINVKGDTNLDGLLNDIDYNLLIDHLLNITTFDLSESWAGDVDHDDRSSIFDLLLLEDIIIYGSNRSN